MTAQAFQQSSNPRLIVVVKDSAGDAVNLVGASLKKIRVSPPSGSSFEATMSYVNTGSDGKLYVDLTAAQIALVGEYRFQVFVTLSGGFSGGTRPASFFVVANLTAP